MTWIWLVPGGVGGVLLTLMLLWLKKAATEELSTRVGKFPLAVVTIAARLLPRDRRDDYRDEWVSDAEQLIADTDGKPLTRIIRNVGFAISLAVRARSLRRLVGPVSAATVQTGKKAGRVFISGAGFDETLGGAAVEQLRRNHVLFAMADLLKRWETPNLPVRVEGDDIDFFISRLGDDDFEIQLVPKRK